MTRPDGEGPEDVEASRARIAIEHGKPEHQFRAGPDGKDPRDEKTRTDELPEEDSE